MQLKPGGAERVYTLLSSLPRMSPTDQPSLFETAEPPAMIDREAEMTVFTSIIEETGWRCLYAHGPYGMGKTLLARTALTTCPDALTTCYIPCTVHDTQYKVLKQAYTLLTDDELNSGYHTAQLQDLLAQQLRGTNTVLVLDDLEFLLDNDGSDLLYYLSRLNQPADLCLIGISATQHDLPTMLDERAYSSLRPRHFPIEPYTADQASRILERRVQTALSADTVNPAALDYITAVTTNVTLGLHWLATATAQADVVTADVVTDTENDAIHRYREAVLSDFTAHHLVLLDAIDQVTTSGSEVYSGTAYNRYTELCRAAGEEPLTLRRISDFLTHLELLNLIHVTHYTGGELGKTREIRLVPLQEV